MSRPGPETRLVKKMRDAGAAKYGERLVTIKYHGSQFGEAGVSDLLCVLDGVFVAVEVKAPESYPVQGEPSVDRAVDEGPTLKQRAFGQRVVKAGGVFAVAASVEQFLVALELAVLRLSGFPLGEPEQGEDDDDTGQHDTGQPE